MWIGGGFQIDLAVSRPNEGAALLLEVKSFEPSSSPADYLAATIGQYVLYRVALDYNEINTPLILVVPASARTSILAEKIGQRAVDHAGLQILVVDLEREELEPWNL